MNVHERCFLCHAELAGRKRDHTRARTAHKKQSSTSAQRHREAEEQRRKEGARGVPGRGAERANRAERARALQCAVVRDRSRQAASLVRPFASV